MSQGSKIKIITNQFDVFNILPYIWYTNILHNIKKKKTKWQPDGIQSRTKHILMATHSIIYNRGEQKWNKLNHKSKQLVRQLRPLKWWSKEKKRLSLNLTVETACSVTTTIYYRPYQSTYILWSNFFFHGTQLYHCQHRLVLKIIIFMIILIYVNNCF